LGMSVCTVVGIATGPNLAEFVSYVFPGGRRLPQNVGKSPVVGAASMWRWVICGANGIEFSKVPTAEAGDDTVYETGPNQREDEVAMLKAKPTRAPSRATKLRISPVRRVEPDPSVIRHSSDAHKDIIYRISAADEPRRSSGP
jgi:hypothetical protein